MFCSVLVRNKARLRELIVPSPASEKSPAHSAMCSTAFAEATERRILHGHSDRSLRLPSLTHCFGVVFLRCPPHSASLPRSCQHGRTLHTSTTIPNAKH